MSSVLANLLRSPHGVKRNAGNLPRYCEYLYRGQSPALHKATILGFLVNLRPIFYKFNGFFLHTRL